MKSTRIVLAFVAVTLTAILGVACNKNTMQPNASEEQKWHAARAICFEQAQDMTNSTVSVSNPATNDFFKSCMRTRFNYTDEELRNRGYKQYKHYSNKKENIGINDDFILKTNPHFLKVCL